MGNTISFVGRLLLGALFVIAGVRKTMAIGGTVDYMTKVGGLPNPELLVYAVIALEIIAGLMLIVGFQARLAALALAAFSVASAVLFHKFWGVKPGDAFIANSGQFNHFMKNVAIAGGLLLVTATSTSNVFGRSASTG